MKKYLLLIIVIATAFSCADRRNAQKALEDRDSLARVVHLRDSAINSVFESLNIINENLNAIKQREDIITTSIGGGEIKRETTAKINEDIEAINQLLLTNRRTISSLENSASQLKKANIKIGSLEKLISDLNTQTEAKDAEITQLRQNLAQLKIEVGDLTNQVTGLSSTVSSLSEDKSRLEGEVKAKGDLMNVAYYIVGSQKELLAKDIVYKSGFIGRTLKINENRSLDNFTKIDMRSFDQVLIGKPDVTLVSSHPKGSYEFVMVDKNIYSSLVITDRAKFWENSKVLVVVYK